jgi:hypothetical protein
MPFCDLRLKWRPKDFLQCLVSAMNGFPFLLNSRMIGGFHCVICRGSGFRFGQRL